jgi:hypothetical protein
VTAGQKRDEGKVDDALLTEDVGSRGLADASNLGANLLDAIDELGIGLGNGCHGFNLSRC